MQIKSVVRAGALVSTLALLAMSGSPALAAEPVAQASATGLVLSIANNPVSTGTFKVVNDGTNQTATGSNQAPLSLLGNQNFLSVGTIAQDAKTTVTNSDGSSAACSGVAGQGASLAAVGGASCLTGGNALELTGAQLDLTKIANISLIQGQTATSLNGVLTTLGLGAVSNQILGTLQTQLNTALAPLANAGLIVGAGAIQSVCTASPGTAQGTANIANAQAKLVLPAPFGEVVLANLPANPAPNTEVVVGLDKVTQVIIDGVTTSLTSTGASSALSQIPGLAALLAGINGGLNTVQTQLVTTLVAQLQPLLKPLQDNVLRATLNKQTKPAADQISVTALDLQVLPAAAAFTGASLVSAQIGTSNCGPSGRIAAVAPTATPTPKNNNDPKNPKEPKVPTSVPAGYADGPTRNAPLGPWALAGLGALLTASVAAGATAYRRSNARL